MIKLNYRKISIIIGLLIVTIATGSAVEVPNLYMGKVIVTDHSLAQRRQAQQQALLQVLIKVSGNAEIATLPNVSAILKSANKFVEAYRYEPPKPYRLLVRFDHQSIDHILRKLGQAIWSRERPLTLIWLVTQTDNDNRQIIYGDENSDAVNIIKQQAFKRGLPVVLPIMDLAGNAQITADDIWNINQPTILQASKRYHADNILVGRVSQGQGHWELIQGTEKIVWETTGDTLAEVITAEINHLANALAARYAVLAQPLNNENAVTLIVNNVQTLKEYATVTKLLRRLTPVASLQVVKVFPHKVAYELKLSGSIEALTQAISLDKRLQPLPMDNGDLVYEAMLGKEAN